MRPFQTILRSSVSILLLVGVAAEASAQHFDGHVAADRVFDEGRAQAAGIRTLTGRHLVLYTDLLAGEAVDALPAVFDAAVPLWAAYFGVDPAETADWRVQVFLIGDREKFAALRLLPPGHDLLHGYSLGSDIWLVEQPTDYYRRHLLLHEGTHLFMNRFLGGVGPGWYAEGMAELLATHRLKHQLKGTGVISSLGEGTHPNAKRLPSPLLLNVMPRDRREVPMLGRIKLVRDALAKDQALSLATVLAIDSRTQLGDDLYAWSWSLAKFLDSHPRYRQRFRTLKDHVRETNFNERVKKLFAAEWNELVAEWQAYVATLEHDYDFTRMAIHFERGKPLRGMPRVITIAADRGWQPSGVWLEVGKSYRLSARGRYRIAVDNTRGGETAWPCEPGGVTIEYHDGHPLGMLLGAVYEGGSEKGEGGGGGVVHATFARPIEIGLGCVISPKRSGSLYLRVNDSGAKLGDNRGALTITVED